MTAPALDWLIARPIAHRGLHKASAGVIENSLGAAGAAIAKGYAIECDVQATRDGDLVVFHDDTLERLTDASGRVDTRDAQALSRLRLKGSSETIPTFAAFLAAIAGGAPLVVELKSHFDGDLRAARRAAELLSAYRGRVVVESFDPAPIAFLRANAEALGVAHVPLGMVGEARYDEKDWPMLSPAQRAEMTHFLHYPRTRPDFLSWSVADLPHAIPVLARQALRIPVTTWTVRSLAQAEMAAQWADQIVFEKFTPG
ncbi:glycerophosphodiester phosphodiesterase family protein [Methylocystis sp. IM3]|uniref:glycerophosphodiester phosphodiesterase family protein n=1 Tax=unclassified Methylocystis TaxID=2625913 RepID=UPI00311A055E